MTLLRPLALAACFAMILSGPANAADHDQAVDCAAVIKVTTQAIPPDHPSASQVRSLIESWTIFAKAQAYPKTINIDDAITARSDEIQRTIMGFQDRAKSQAYVTELGGQCQAPPYEAVEPYRCKRIAEAMKEIAETGVMLQNYVGWNTTEEKSKAEMQESDRKRAAKILTEKRRILDAESLIKYYQHAKPETAGSLVPHDDTKRQAAYETCQKQKG